jgi:outer membrane lipopolysaccharide assembly protein LptE/RlpB
MKRILFLSVLSLTLAACGYTFQGRGTKLPPDVRTVGIAIFANRTIQTGIESQISGGFVDRFTSAQRLPVVDQGSADALLTGTIKTFTLNPIAVTSATQIATAYQIIMIVEVQLLRQRDRSVLYRADLSEYGTYNVDANLNVTEANKREAVRLMSISLAGRVHELMLESF